MTDNSGKRRTLSLNLNVSNYSSKRNDNSKFKVEVKRKRRGLTVNIDKSGKINPKYNHKINQARLSKLTDKEFKVRVKALQEAMRSEQSNNLVPPGEVKNDISNNAVRDNNIINVSLHDKNSLNVESSSIKFKVSHNVEKPKQDIEKNGNDNVVTVKSKVISESIPSKPVVFRFGEFSKRIKPRLNSNTNKEIGTTKQYKERRYDSSKSQSRNDKYINKDKFNVRLKSNNENSNQRSFLSRNITNNKDSKYEKNEITDIPIPEKQNISRLSTKSKVKFIEDNGVGSRKKSLGKSKIEKRNINSGKITRIALERAMNDESEERTRSLASVKRARMKHKNLDKSTQEINKVIREVLIPDTITIGELASRMAVRASEVVKYLMSVGTIVTINQAIDGETAEVVCTSFGHTVKRVSDNDIEMGLNFDELDNVSSLVPRAPIVAVMGHVDHGKTTLLDTLRKSAVAQKEAGGITQHVAAYQVNSSKGKRITFIDTPGHAAFANIRARGAILTDIIVLVVAADDGIKDQTIEVIKQAKSQNVPLIIAINKIDKPNINITKIKTDLMAHEVLLEEFGGDVLSCEISAKQNVNLDKLLDTILLQADVLDLKANKNRSANGTILEAKIEKGRGTVASVIIQGGTLKNGDIFVAGSTFGKVRAIYDSNRTKLIQAGPSAAVELIGFDGIPEPGDTIVVVDNEQIAREIADRRRQNKPKLTSKDLSVKMMDQMMERNDIKTLNVFVKADVYGSLEAIEASLTLIKHPEIKVKLIGKDIGVISESDIDFAKTSDAIVIGFNIGITATAKDRARLHNIKILNHNIIYHLIEEVKSIMSSMLAPIIEEQYTGTADVKKLFIISRLGTIAGCYVSDGIIKRNNSKIKVMRNSKCIFEGKIKSMKHEKDEIKESKQNHECGILIDGYNECQERDKIECYEIVYKNRVIE